MSVLPVVIDPRSISKIWWDGHNSSSCRECGNAEKVLNGTCQLKNFNPEGFASLEAKSEFSEIMKHARESNVPIVIDGDGLFLVTNCLDLVRDYLLAVLTPNINEYKRLVQKVLNCEVNDQEGPQQLLSLAKG
ncbi:unnamed protein product [Fraxinus pennsylvanica]|uniref:YjeF C-terminal domain-containing protein n=1 Tax=Fraxinus pennsylvanica TaxID=56036 RepID=A0AAD2DW15_9LAMI|nr:unnamed protein product [Fraxinus pennsylvanica]